MKIITEKNVMMVIFCFLVVAIIGTIGIDISQSLKPHLWVGWAKPAIGTSFMIWSVWGLTRTNR